jgi:predicted DNA-binding transcriptional regulator YafY
MNFANKTEKLDYLLQLIKTGTAGNANELRYKICVSPRTFARLIAELRRQGYQIGFCNFRKSYYLIDQPNNMIQK